MLHAFELSLDDFWSTQDVWYNFLTMPPYKIPEVMIWLTRTCLYRLNKTAAVSTSVNIGEHHRTCSIGRYVDPLGFSYTFQVPLELKGYHILLFIKRSGLFVQNSSYILLNAKRCLHFYILLYAWDRWHLCYPFRVELILEESKYCCFLPDHH